MITFDIDTRAQLVLCTAVRGVGILDLSNYLHDLLCDPRFKPTFNTLIVADAASIPPFSMLRFFDPVVAAWTQRRGTAKYAFVLPDAMSKAVVEEQLQQLTLNRVQARCFVSEEEARAWLGNAEPAASLEHRLAHPEV